LVSCVNRSTALDYGFFSYRWIFNWLSLFIYFYSCSLVINFSYFVWISFCIMRGSLIWNSQRYSSLIILCYLVYIASFIISQDEINFFSWSNFFLSFEVRFLTSFIFIMIVVHAYIGLWTVGTDYLTSRTLGFLNKSIAKRAKLMRNTYFFTFGLLGIVYLSSILYIIWL